MDPNSNKSYFHILPSTPMLGLTMHELINHAANKFGNSEAVCVAFQNTRRTFKQLKSDATTVANNLLGLGLKPGDRLAVWCPNMYESLLSYWAGWTAGLIMVGLNPALQGPELLYCLNKVGVKGLLVGNHFRNQNLYEMLTTIVPELKSVGAGADFFHSQHSPKAIPSLEIVLAVEPDLPGTIHFDQLLHNKANGNQLLHDGDCILNILFDNVAVLLLTSGTTGIPKAVKITHHSLINNANYFVRKLDYRQNDKVCIPVPVFHSLGIVNGLVVPLLYGNTVVIPSHDYHPSEIVKVCAKERCDSILGPPTIISDVLNASSNMMVDIPSLKLIASGGAPLAMPLLQEIRRKFPEARISNGYGMTELGGMFLSVFDSCDALICSSSVGYPCENSEVKLVNKKGEIVPLGEGGELCVRSFAVTPGFWGDDEKSIVDNSGWFHTGDIFVMHPSGKGTYVARLKDIIIRGGENINPKEIEDFLKSHPNIVEACVFGVPNARLGEKVAAWIQTKETMTKDDVNLFFKGKITRVKIPEVVIFRSDFPRTPLGKLQKYKMQEETALLMETST